MGALKEQAKGAAQQVKGKAKEIVGKAIGNPGLQIKGSLEKNIGKVRQADARSIQAGKGRGRIRRETDG
jgi:uncharacterized protein YjbJ (UPF0337 family)